MRLTPPELHRSDRPSFTAQWTTLARAAELRRPPHERIVSDEYAPYFLGGTGRALIASLRVAAPVYGAVERTRLASVIGFALCRHRFIDTHLSAELNDGCEQVLILGAGYDSRAYRFADQLRGRPVHEVDLPPLSRRKAGIVAANPDAFGHNTIRRIEIDFRTESLADRLLESGFAVGAPTFVVWEGVSPYLDRAAVESTLDTLDTVCGKGSTLAMDFYRQLPGASPRHRIRNVATRGFSLVGEPLTFPIDPDPATDLLDEHGFAIVDLAGSNELAARYSTGGRPSEEATYVVAARKR